MSKLKKYLPLVILTFVIALICLACIPFIKWIGQEGNLLILRDYILEQGLWGAFLFLLLQIAQIVFAVIPGEPIELVAGMIYGTWGGLIICLIGILIGSTGIFMAVRKLGKGFVNRFFSDEQIGKYAFFNSAEKLDALIFIMFLIPGTPKDVLTYVCPLTPIKPLHFIMLSTFARIPSIVSSTYAGATFSQGNVWGSVAILSATMVLGLMGIMFQKKFTQALEKKKSKD